jgi:hypothetical protein
MLLPNSGYGSTLGIAPEINGTIHPIPAVSVIHYYLERDTKAGVLLIHILQLTADGCLRLSLKFFVYGSLTGATLRNGT